MDPLSILASLKKGVSKESLMPLVSPTKGESDVVDASEKGKKPTDAVDTPNKDKKPKDKRPKVSASLAAAAGLKRASEETPMEVEDSVEEDKSKQASAKDSKERKDEKKSKKRKICGYFNTPAGCKTGSSCKFYHAEGAEMFAHLKSDRFCLHFGGAKGCSKGDKCTFIHSKEWLESETGVQAIKRAKKEKEDNPGETVSVAASDMPHLIGKKGAVIKKIREETRTHIAETSTRMTESTFTIKGTPENIAKAKAMIAQHIESTRQAIEAEKAKAQLTIELSEEEVSCMSIVIGKGGQTVQNIQAKTSTKIHYDESGKKVIIKGESEDNVAQARAMVAEQIQRYLTPSAKADMIVADEDMGCVGIVIGKGAANLKPIEDSTSTSIDISKKGKVTIRGQSDDDVAKAQRMIVDLFKQVKGKDAEDKKVNAHRLEIAVSDKDMKNIGLVMGNLRKIQADTSTSIFINDEKKIIYIKAQSEDAITQAKATIEDLFKLAEKPKEQKDSKKKDKVKVEINVSDNDPRILGKLVGKNGENIKNIQSATFTWIDVDKEAKKIIIKGRSEDDVAKAKARIEEEIQSSHIMVGMGNPLKVEIVVPEDQRKCMGLLVGKGGGHIKVIEGETSTSIGVNKGEGTIIIRGKEEDCVAKAKAVVEDYLKKASESEGERVPKGVPGAIEVEMVLSDEQKSKVGNIIGKKGENIKKTEGQTSTHIDVNAKNIITIRGESQQAVEKAKSVLEQQLNACKQSETMTLNDEEMSNLGKLVGKGGQTIKQMEGETSTHIKLDRSVKIITIRGESMDNIAKAKELVRQQLTPSRPRTTKTNSYGSTDTLVLSEGDHLGRLKRNQAALVKKIEAKTSTSISMRGKEGHIEIRGESDEKIAEAKEMISKALKPVADDAMDKDKKSKDKPKKFATDTITVRDEEWPYVDSLKRNKAALVKEIEAETSTRISVSSQEGHIEIKGKSAENIAKAKELIQNVLKPGANDAMDVDAKEGSVSKPTKKRSQSKDKENPKKTSPSLAPGAAPSKSPMNWICTWCAKPGHMSSRCPNRRCLKCGEKGHTDKECNTMLRCNTCGKSGHIDLDCLEGL